MYVSLSFMMRFHLPGGRKPVSLEMSPSRNEKERDFHKLSQQTAVFLWVVCLFVFLNQPNVNQQQVFIMDF